MESQGGSGFRGALARLRHAPLWVWLTVLLTFGLLVFAYLQYRKSSSSSASGTTSAALGTVPGSGSGQPLWSSADTSGMITGNGSDMQAILAYINSLQTPNPSPTASPTTPPPVSTPTTPPPVIAPGPSGGVNPPPSSPSPTGSGAKYFTITQNYSSANRQTTTLSGIAGLYHTTVARLMQLNPNITNPNLVYKGERIRVQ